MKQSSRIVTVTPNPAIDQTLAIAHFAAGKVNRVESSRLDAGGKGVNVATLLGDLGVQVCVTGFLGAENATIFETHFAAHHLEDRFVRVAGATRIGIKIADTATAETTDINFPGVEVDGAALSQLETTVADLAASNEWTVLSGSLPKGLDADFYRRMIDVVHTHGGKVALDTSGAPLHVAVAARPEILKPNVTELEELVGRALPTMEAIRAAAEELLVDRTQLVVVSMGGDGALFLTREEALVARPPKVKVVSTVGAGDAMVAGLVSAQTQELTLEETAALATAFGAYAVTRCGAGLEAERVTALKEQVKLEKLAGRAIAVEGVL
ncbi:1-phosphofructokinase [Telmatobacter bradus]|uniref:1-phosphofructokinase n=1 Tax=Telmatobacter bradus TaxID=474953 RepID=UPI003B42D6F0